MKISRRNWSTVSKNYGMSAQESEDLETEIMAEKEFDNDMDTFQEQLNINPEV